MLIGRPNYIWISVFFHLVLFLLFFFLEFHPTSPIVVQKEESYYYYVPAYTASMMTPPAKSSHTQENDKVKSIDKIYDLSLIKTSYQNHYQAVDLHQLNQSTSTNLQQKYQEAIHLVGDKFLDDPLRKLLGRAITPHIFYPDVARELYMRGVVSIELVLHPDGNITHAHIVKSSRERILDAAAIRALNDSSPINGVDLYIKEPRHLVINIIF